MSVSEQKQEAKPVHCEQKMSVTDCCVAAKSEKYKNNCLKRWK